MDVPRSFVAGDSVELEITDPDHSPVEGWGAQWVIQTPTPTVTSAVVVDDGFTFELASADSATITPGQYAQYLVYTNGAQRETVQQESVLILPNPLVSATPTWAQSTLLLVEGAITKLSRTSNSQVSINGETYTKQSIDKLLELRNYLVTIAASELKAQGKPAPGGPKTIVCTFTS